MRKRFLPWLILFLSAAGSSLTALYFTSDFKNMAYQFKMTKPKLMGVIFVCYFLGCLLLGVLVLVTQLTSTLPVIKQIIASILSVALPIGAVLLGWLMKNDTLYVMFIASYSILFFVLMLGSRNPQAEIEDFGITEALLSVGVGIAVSTRKKLVFIIIAVALPLIVKVLIPKLYEWFAKLENEEEVQAV